MGKKDKVHRQKVAKRNQKIQDAQKVYKKMYDEMLTQHVEMMKQEKLSGDTPTDIAQ